MFEATPQPGCEPSSGLVELPLTIASEHLAQCLVLDIVHVTEEGIDSAGKVLYGQLINEPYDKIIAPVPRTRQLSWSPALRHRKFDNAVLDKLVNCCREMPEVHTRRCVLLFPILVRTINLLTMVLYKTCW